MGVVRLIIMISQKNICAHSKMYPKNAIIYIEIIKIAIPINDMWFISNVW